MSTAKSKKQKININNIYIIFIHSFYKTTGFDKSLILRNSVIKKQQKNDKKASKKRQKSNKKASKKRHLGLTCKKTVVTFSNVKKGKEATWQSIT